MDKLNKETYFNGNFILISQAGSPFREPLIKFLTRHPSQTVELFMMEATLNDPQWSRMFMVTFAEECHLLSVTSQKLLIWHLTMYCFPFLSI